MKLSIFAVLFLAFVTKEVVSQACHMREVDLCMAIGMFHFQSNGIPEDEEKIDEFCEAYKEVGDCLGNFSAKCLSPVQKELISLFSGADDQAMRLCTPGSEARAKYLQHGECISNAYDGDVFKGIMRDLQVALEKVFEMDFYKRLPGLCCGMKRFQQDVYKNTERLCGVDAVETTKYIVTMITTDIPDVLCQGHDAESDTCQSILPARGSKGKGSASKSQLVRLLDTMFGTA